MNRSPKAFILAPVFLALLSAAPLAAEGKTERVINLLDQTPEVSDLPGARPAPAFVGAIHFEGVSFAYEASQNVLERIDFDIKPGQQVAVVGPSGIGKSTLVNLLLRFYDPVWGRVRIDGADIREFTLGSLRSQIGVVLQDTFLFAASVRDNIAFGAPQAGRASSAVFRAKIPRFRGEQQPKLREMIFVKCVFLSF